MSNQNKKIVLVIVALVMLVVVAFFATSKNNTKQPLKVGIAPYQDMSLLFNAKSESFQKKYNLDLKFITLSWQDLIPATSSATDSLDIAFSSITDFISNERNINRNTDDPLVFIYPAYIFLGGSFVSFNPDVPVITRDDLNNREKLRNFLSHSFASQVKSSYDIMLYRVAEDAGVNFKDINITNIDSGEGLLAALNGSVDATGAGLTQRNEALEKGGRVVLTMEDLGFVDVAGFVVKRSVLDKRGEEIKNFVKLWYDSIDYVMSDVDNNSADSIDYLDKQSSTNYTVDSFKQALSQEFFPHNIAEVNKTVLSPGSKYDFQKIKASLVSYMLDKKIIDEEPQNIHIIDIN